MFRSACSIPLDDKVIITGGYYTKSTVSEYSQAGWVGDLATLNVGRYGHGCSSFVSGAERVRVTQYISALWASLGVDLDKTPGSYFFDIKCCK